MILSLYILEDWANVLVCSFKVSGIIVGGFLFLLLIYTGFSAIIKGISEWDYDKFEDENFN